LPEQPDDVSDPRPLVSLAEAAAATGRHPEALRGMVRRGRLTAVRGNDGRLLVRLPADLTAGQQPAETRLEAGLLDEMAEVREEAAGLRTALARAEAERDAAKAVAAAETTMLREALEREHARVDRLEEALRRPWWRRLVGG
jgi:multidrug resistance efflux pump